MPYRTEFPSAGFAKFAIWWNAVFLLLFWVGIPILYTSVGVQPWIWAIPILGGLYSLWQVIRAARWLKVYA